MNILKIHEIFEVLDRCWGTEKYTTILDINFKFPIYRISLKNQ